MGFCLSLGDGWEEGSCKRTMGREGLVRAHTHMHMHLYVCPCEPMGVYWGMHMNVQ